VPWLGTPVFTPAASRTSRRSSGAAAIWAAALAAIEREQERLASCEKAKLWAKNSVDFFLVQKNK